MMQYKIGNLFENLHQISSKVVVIPHIVNDIGAWGSGFVVPLGERFPRAEDQYRKDHEEHRLELGTNSYINAKEGNKLYIIANMCAQVGTINSYNKKPIRYEALLKCLKDLRQHIYDDLSGNITFFPQDEWNTGNYEFHAPAFGSNRAGGDWRVIKALTEEIFGDSFKWTIYTLSKEEQESLGV